MGTNGPRKWPGIANPVPIGQSGANPPIRCQSANPVPILCQSANPVPIQCQSVNPVPILCQSSANRSIQCQSANLVPIRCQSGILPPLQILLQTASTVSFCQCCANLPTYCQYSILLHACQSKCQRKSCVRFIATESGLAQHWHPV